MSSRELEERQEQEQAKRVAAALGISVDDLSQLDWSMDENTGHDGAFYGYNITFGEGSDPDVLAEIDGLVDGRWIRIGPVL